MTLPPLQPASRRPPPSPRTPLSWSRRTPPTCTGWTPGTVRGCAVAACGLNGSGWPCCGFAFYGQVTSRRCSSYQRCLSPATRLGRGRSTCISSLRKLLKRLRCGVLASPGAAAEASLRALRLTCPGRRCTECPERRQSSPGQQLPEALQTGCASTFPGPKLQQTPVVPRFCNKQSSSCLVWVLTGAECQDLRCGSCVVTRSWLQPLPTDSMPLGHRTPRGLRGDMGTGGTGLAGAGSCGAGAWPEGWRCAGCGDDAHSPSPLALLTSHHLVLCPHRLAGARSDRCHCHRLPSGYVCACGLGHHHAEKVLGLLNSIKGFSVTKPACLSPPSAPLRPPRGNAAAHAAKGAPASAPAVSGFE